MTETKEYRMRRTGDIRMRIVWNRELKKLAIMMCGVFFAGMLVMNLWLEAYCSKARAEYGSLLSEVFGSVLRAYPEMREEELVQVLSRCGDQEYGEEILARYGLLKEYGSASFAGQESRLLVLRAQANLILILLLGAAGFLACGYIRKRQERISGLTDYMGALNRCGYGLEVEDNVDDELSGLRNEIYKLTIFLREQADRAMEQKRTLSETMADISHQLKTPLTSVTVLMDNLSDDEGMEAPVRRQFMAEITRQLSGMSWLITTMLKLSRLEAGVLELKREHFEVRDFVEETLQRLELAAEWQGVSFSVSISEGMALDADRRWTGEALMNIVKNAIEHSPAGGTVEISGEDNEVYGEIAIRDWGQGITKEEQEKLFQRFYNGRCSREDSMGIGLALAKGIVEEQEGHITVDSRIGKGTVFRIRFLKEG